MYVAVVLPTTRSANVLKYGLLVREPSSWLRWAWRAGAGAFAVGLWVAACGSGTATGKGFAESCSLNSDCNDPLICALGKCRNQCVTSADCTAGASCVTDAHNA